MSSYLLVEIDLFAKNTVLTKRTPSSTIHNHYKNKEMFMSYWNSVLDEVLHKDSHDESFLFSNHDNLIDSAEHDDITDHAYDPFREARDLRTYYLGKDYPNVYFTKREAECIFWVVQGRTISETAYKMQLSARTVEYYVKNMKLKLGCESKKQLIDKILQTTLLQQLEKDGMRIVKH